MPNGFLLPRRRSALIVAHPGHELRVHGWLEQVHPVVFVLTDGSGSTRESRLEGTERVLAAAGARPGAVFGRFPDRRWYEAILEGDVPFFTTLVDEIATALISEQIEVVVSDAEEGYNSGHDICRALVDAAVTVVQSATGRQLLNLDFLLVGSPDSTGNLPYTSVRLDDPALQRKLAAARGYPEMASEVDAALQRFGAEAFRLEYLRLVAPDGPRSQDEHDVPFYERFGEQQVAAGLYTSVIRAREHVHPLRDALQQYATRRSWSRSSSC